MKPVRTLLILAAVGGMAGSALAQSTVRTRPPETIQPGENAALTAVVACRSQTEAAARLACYDAAVQALQAATASGEIVVVDRGQVREARRQIFGFTVPALDLFGRGGDRAAQDQVDEVEGVVASTSFGRDGKRTIRLEGGAVWRQFGSEDIRVRAGSRVRITRGMIGSYFMRVDNQPGVRVSRVQ